MPRALCLSQTAPSTASAAAVWLDKPGPWARPKLLAAASACAATCPSAPPLHARYARPLPCGAPQALGAGGCPGPLPVGCMRAHHKPAPPLRRTINSFVKMAANRVPRVVKAGAGGSLGPADARYLRSTPAAKDWLLRFMQARGAPLLHAAPCRALASAQLGRSRWPRLPRLAGGPAVPGSPFPCLCWHSMPGSLPCPHPLPVMPHMPGSPVLHVSFLTAPSTYVLGACAPPDPGPTPPRPSSLLQRAYQHGVRGVLGDYRVLGRDWRVDLQAVCCRAALWHGSDDKARRGLGRGLHRQPLLRAAAAMRCAGGMLCQSPPVACRLPALAVGMPFL